MRRFLENHPDFELEAVERFEGMEAGRAECMNYSGENSQIAEGIERTIRLWPHKLRGEGHFVAVLHKAGERLSGEKALGAGMQAGKTHMV